MLEGKRGEVNLLCPLPFSTEVFIAMHCIRRLTGVRPSFINGQYLHYRNEKHGPCHPLVIFFYDYGDDLLCLVMVIQVISLL